MGYTPYLLLDFELKEAKCKLFDSRSRVQLPSPLIVGLLGAME
jgi:hypothetical protein